MPTLPAAPVVPPAPPRRKWWVRFTDRKFLMPALVLVALIVGVAIGAIPFAIPAVMLAASCVLAFVAGEAHLDGVRAKVAALYIPEVPGAKDDVARMLRDALGELMARIPDPVNGTGPLANLMDAVNRADRAGAFDSTDAAAVVRSRQS